MANSSSIIEKVHMYYVLEIVENKCGKQMHVCCKMFERVKKKSMKQPINMPPTPKNIWD